MIDGKLFSGTKYFFLFVDRRTSYYHAHTSRTKDGFITTLKLVYEDYASHGHKMLSFRSDSEQIMVVGDVAAFLASNGTDQQWSLPYQHYQNLVERHVQTISKAISTIILDQNLLGSSFWGYALQYIIWLKNCTPNTKPNGLAPYQMFTGKPIPSLDRINLYPFGTPVAINDPQPDWKFSPKNHLGVFLGQSKGNVNGGLVYVPHDKSIKERGNLTSIQDKISTTEFHTISAHRNTTVSDNEINRLASQPLTNNSARQSARTILTRAMSKKGATSALSIQAQPSITLHEALIGPDTKLWKEALQTELDSSLNTPKSLIPETPDWNNRIHFDIIFATSTLKKKMIDANTVDKYKVRLCACGKQLANNDLDSTFSPTVNERSHT